MRCRCMLTALTSNCEARTRKTTNPLKKRSRMRRAAADWPAFPSTPPLSGCATAYSCSSGVVGESWMYRSNNPPVPPPPPTRLDPTLGGAPLPAIRKLGGCRCWYHARRPSGRRHEGMRVAAGTRPPARGERRERCLAMGHLSFPLRRPYSRAPRGGVFIAQTRAGLLETRMRTRFCPYVHFRGGVGCRS